MPTHIYYQRLVKEKILTNDVIENAILSYSQLLDSTKSEESEWHKINVLPQIKERKLIDGEQPFIYYIWAHCFPTKNYGLVELDTVPKAFLDSVSKRIAAKMILSENPNKDINISEYTYDFHGTKYLIFESLLHGNEEGQVPFYTTRGDGGYNIESLAELNFYLNYCRKLDNVEIESKEYSIDVMKKLISKTLPAAELEHNKQWIGRRLTLAHNEAKSKITLEVDNHPDLALDKIQSTVLQQLENELVLFTFGSMTEQKIETFKEIYRKDDFIVEIA